MRDSKLAFESQFGESFAKWGVKEIGIVAEAAVTAGWAANFAINPTLHNGQYFFPLCQSNDANIMSPARRMGQFFQLAEQLLIVGFVAGIGSGKARGMNARSASERINTKPGIVGKDQGFGVPAIV